MARTKSLLLASLLLALPTAARAETQPVDPAMPAPDEAVDPASDQPLWWISPAGVAVGPYSVAELLILARDGVVAHDTPVWREGMTDWQLLGDTTELTSVQKALSGDPPGDPEEAARHYLLGTWTGEGAYYEKGERFYITARYDFRANGSFAAVETSLPSGLAEQHNVVALKGSWGVKVIDASRIEVLFVHAAGQGKEQTEEVYSFEIIDQDTIRDTTSDLTMYRQR